MKAIEQAYAELKTAARGWGLDLSPEQTARIDRFLNDLLSANAKVNLSADQSPQTVLLRHIADGLAAAAALRREMALVRPRILDLGSGGGYIGMAVKIAWPEAHMTLMESVQRKYRFLNAMAVRSGLAGLTVSSRRAGEGSKAPETNFDAVLARALAPLPEAAALALPLCGTQGLCLIFQSQAPDANEPRLARVLARHGARLVKSIQYRLPREERDRHLALFRK